MKTNFKYLMMAFAVLFGAASCSNNDDGGTTLPVEGEPTFVTIDLVQESDVTRAPLTENATTAESTIKSAKVYVFNALKVLEQIVDFNATEVAAKKKVFETTTGLHYFLAVANAPDVTVDLGTGMKEVETVLSGIDKAKFDGYTVANEFFMTSGLNTTTYRDVEAASKDLIISTEADAPTKNPVTINIGRAMGKLSFTYDATAVTYDEVELGGTKYPKAGGKIDASTVKYVVTNNPSSMYYFPYFVNEQFQTPNYAAYNEVFAPSDYWPALHTATLSYTAPKTGVNVNYSYIMENSNKVPTYGNATIVSVEAKFVPDAKFVTGTISGSTFYRIWNIKNAEFVGRTLDGVANQPLFFASTGDITTFADAQTTGSGTGGAWVADTDYNVETYTGGISYYIIPVADKSKSAPVRYNVYRNHYYDVAISKVNGCGYGTPGGSPETDPKDPLDPDDVWMEAKINVLPWVKVQQEEELGPR